MTDVEVPREFLEAGSLLSRMTADTNGELKFTPAQTEAIIQVMIPRMVTNMPGMPAGMKCTVDKDENGWTLRIDRP